MGDAAREVEVSRLLLALVPIGLGLVVLIVLELSVLLAAWRRPEEPAEPGWLEEIDPEPGGPGLVGQVGEGRDPAASGGMDPDTGRRPPGDTGRRPPGE